MKCDNVAEKNRNMVNNEQKKIETRSKKKGTPDILWVFRCLVSSHMTNSFSKKKKKRAEFSDTKSSKKGLIQNDIIYFDNKLETKRNDGQTNNNYKPNPFEHVYWSLAFGGSGNPDLFPDN